MMDSMNVSARDRISGAEAQAFLETLHDTPVTQLEQLSGGHWSAAFAYECDGARLVARFGHNRDWFEVDRDAHSYASANLPVPRVLAIGDAGIVGDGLVFAISERADGTFLEDVDPADASRVRPLVGRLLEALRNASLIDDVDYTWRGWLEAGIDPEGRNAQWRALVAQDPYAGPIGEVAERRVRELLDGVPERRELVHGDLLHGNVLVADDLGKLNAVFSWKCSARGDALYDVAWLTFWSPWYPGIESIDPRTLVEDDRDAALRHHCYELHIGTNHLSWFAQVDDHESLHRVAAELERRIDEH